MHPCRTFLTLLLSLPLACRLYSAVWDSDNNKISRGLTWSSEVVKYPIDIWAEKHVSYILKSTQNNGDAYKTE